MMAEHWPWFYAGGALVMLSVEVCWHTFKAGGGEIESKQIGQSLFIALIWPVSFPLGVAVGVGAAVGRIVARRKRTTATSGEVSST
jgi:hypothetical protein